MFSFSHNLLSFHIHKIVHGKHQDLQNANEDDVNDETTSVSLIDTNLDKYCNVQNGVSNECWPILSSSFISRRVPTNDLHISRSNRLLI